MTTLETPRIIPPSQEFQSLQITSQLPPWITHEGQLADHWLVYMAGIHADERNQIEYARRLMSPGYCPPGTLPLIAHLLAAKAINKDGGEGVRFLGKSQLLNWFEGRFEWEVPEGENSNQEEPTAAGITWLAEHIAKKHAFIDNHDNYNGLHYGLVGKSTAIAPLAIAHIMGIKDLCVVDVPNLLHVIPNWLSVEQPIPPNPAAKAEAYLRSDEQLRIIAGLGYQGLIEYFADNKVLTKPNYYDRVKEVCLADPDTRELDKNVLKVLKELEEQLPGEHDKPTFGRVLHLSEQVREVLELDRTREYLDGSVPYNSFAEEIKLDTATLRRYGLEDRPRRLVFTTIVAHTEPPVADPKANGRLTFSSSTR